MSGANGSADLHTHTLYSDGLLTSAELVQQAAALRLTTLAITDHDNTRGYRAARPEAASIGMRLIPGVEFATRWDGYGWPEWGNVVDLLGYFFDPDEPEFRQLETAALGEYFTQLGEACEEARRLGYPITFAEAEAVLPTYPSVFTMLEALIDKGAVEEADSDRALGDLVSCWQRVCHIEFAIGDVIEIIHRAGGVAVLAHPSVVFRPDGGLLQAEDLASLVEMGLDGIEIYHYRLADEATRQHFARLAHRFDLAIGGGSDYHARPESPARLGSEPITDQMVAALEARRR